MTFSFRKSYTVEPSKVRESDRKNHQEAKATKPETESNRKYNSQFNPALAKQNKLQANQKYWLE